MKLISRKKNIIVIIIGIILVLICIFDLYGVYRYGKSWPDDLFSMVMLIIGMIGVGFIFIGAVNIIFLKDINQNILEPDYGFEYEKELLIYQNIGRKKAKPRAGVVEFSKYSEWKLYIEEKYKRITNNEDAYRYMIQKLRNKRSDRELLTSLIIPLEIVILSVIFPAGTNLEKEEMFFSCIITVVIIAVILVNYYMKYKDEINFISDFINIVFPTGFSCSKSQPS